MNKVDIEFGDVRVKVASRNGFTKYAPEYEDLGRSGIKVSAIGKMRLTL